jgi:DNA-binding transcriptional ArsR family regulator
MPYGGCVRAQEHPMPQSPGDLLVHPVRLRAIRALLQQPMTATDLLEVLGDVAQATLYRHLAALEEGGIIEVVERRRARGGVERTFAVVEGTTVLQPEDLAGASSEDHLRWFTSFIGTLLGDFAAYLDDPDADVVADRVGYRQVPLWLTDAEVDDLAEELQAAVERRRSLTTILVPDDRARGSGDG